MAEHPDRGQATSKMNLSPPIVRVNVDDDFKGERVVLVAMNSSGVGSLRDAVQHVLANQEAPFVAMIGGTRHYFRLGAHSLIEICTDGSVGWAMSATSYCEIADKLGALEEARVPAHHYVDIGRPTSTLVLSSEEYV